MTGPGAMTGRAAPVIGGPPSRDRANPPEETRRPHWIVPVLRNLRRSPLGTGGVLVVSAVVCMAFAAPLLAPYDPTAIDLSRSLRAPTWERTATERHWLGTDALGRDVLSRIIYGARISLLVGLASVVVAGSLGTLVGVVCGYFGGRLDAAFMRVVDVQMAFPDILLAIAIMAVLGQGLLNLVAVLGFTGWASYARIVRAGVLSLREREYVHAAQAIGIGNRRMLLRHILPNMLSPIIVLASFGVAGNIISESSLSFLGLGVKPSTPTWGSILADGRDYIRDAWWLTTFAGLATMITVASINLIGDWLRDYLDPKLRIER